MSDAPQVVVVGGGITGAAALHWLASAGIDVRLVEASTQLGGVIGSLRTTSGALVETGPNSIQLAGAALLRLVDELSLRDEMVVANASARKRFIVRGGRLVAVPLSPGAALRTPLLSPLAKLRLMREPWISPGNDSDESIASFVERRLGREVLDHFINPFVSGVYAGRPESLSLRHAFPSLHALECEHGSLVRGALARRRKRAHAPRGLVSFRDGMAALPRAVESRWRDLIDLASPVERIERVAEGWRVHAGTLVYTTPNVVVATSAPVAARLVSQLDAQLAASLAGIEHASVASVATVYRRASIAHPLDGFGCLVPEVERRRVLGIVFNSTLFDGRAAHGDVLLTTFAGGAREPDLVNAHDAELSTIVHAEHQALFGALEAPIETTITRWTSAIPQYRVGYAEVLDAIGSSLDRLPGLYLAGSYRGGVSVGNCASTALSLAESIATSIAQHR